MSEKYMLLPNSLLLPPREYFKCPSGQRHGMFTPSLLHALLGYGPKSVLLKIGNFGPFHPSSFDASGCSEHAEFESHSGHAAILVLTQCTHKLRHVFIGHRG